MKRCLLFLPVALTMLATPAMAEKLTFDFRLYPPLKQVLDSGQSDMVHSDQSNRRYLFDRIAIQGKSGTDWTESIEIVARTPARSMATPADWLAELRGRLPRNCASEITTLSQDEISITFERRSTNCGPAVPRTGIYRIVAGRRSLFMLAGLYRGDMTPQMRQQWLDLMASAHLQ